MPCHRSKVHDAHRSLHPTRSALAWRPARHFRWLSRRRQSTVTVTAQPGRAGVAVSATCRWPARRCSQPVSGQQLGARHLVIGWPDRLDASWATPTTPRATGACCRRAVRAGQPPQLPRDGLRSNAETAIALDKRNASNCSRDQRHPGRHQRTVVWWTWSSAIERHAAQRAHRGAGGRSLLAAVDLGQRFGADGASACA